VSGFLLAVTVTGLTACRTSPSVAAYVGEEQVTVAELEAAVDERRTDPDIDAFAQNDPGAFTRRVLTLLVQEEVHAVAMERFDVRVDDDEVRARIEQLLGQDDPDAVFGQLATQGVARADVFENVRQQLAQQHIAEQEGQAEGLTEEALRADYDESRESLARLSFGYITTPDQAAADAVLAQLTAAPDSYGTVAAQYPGPTTLPELAERAPGDVPAPLAEQFAAAEPGTGFTLAVPEVGGVIVGFVKGIVYPTFEEVRPQLEQQAADQAVQAGSALIEEVRSDLDVTVNPRFGAFQEGQLQPGGGDLVDLLEDDGTSAEQAPPAN
jgi:peptidyl-prolyl cis-trans isomerase SurA